jgi:transketolase
MNNLSDIARSLRAKVLEISYKAGTPHIGSALSCIDILTAAYWSAMKIDPAQPNRPDRDRFILSKGHAATAQYVALAYRGFYSMDLLDTYAVAGACLPEHPSAKSPAGIEVASGSLGHGLSLGLGMAAAGKIRGLGYRVFVVMSDGECNEGSVWEAALLAPAKGIDNLIAIVDYNKWQATGRSDEVTSIGPLAEKWRAFGWSTYEVDGHDLDALSSVLGKTPDGSGKPVAVIAHTIKGKGVSFMEDDNNWHYRLLKADELEAAKRELGVS